MRRVKNSPLPLNMGALENKKAACLTLDIEADHCDLLREPSYEGLAHIGFLVDFLKKHSIPLTCFVQGSLLETHPAEIEKLESVDAEFELHSYSHPKPSEADSEWEIARGKQVYVDFFGRDPVGYRFPLGVAKDTDYEILRAHGFRFDSSVFPTLRPGSFNNLSKPTNPHILDDTGIVEFPISVFSNTIRIPLALSYIKLFGSPYAYLIKKLPLPNFIVFGFHLHDLFRLSSSEKIPMQECSLVERKIFKRIYLGGEGMVRLDEFVVNLKRRKYEFLKLGDVYETIVSEK